MAVAENAEGEKWTCGSGGTTCEITDLPCGQMFNVYVSGKDGDCMGARSNVKVIETAPCVPQQITKELDCPTGALNVSWEIKGIMPLSVEYYEYDQRGGVLICFKLGCHPSDGNCMIPDQQCGSSFDFKLKAVGTKCNSSRSAPQPITTAPCPPKSYDTTVDCASGVVSVSWTDGAVGVLYEVTAVGGDLVEHRCSSSNGGCDLDSLQCGSEYNFTITPSRDGCVGLSSPPRTFSTVPCVPQLKEVDIDCLTNSVWVTWTEANGAEDYVITATNSAGVQTFECNATLDNMCMLPHLACSMNFTFTVQAQDYQCSSAHSNAVMAETGPCSPVNLVSQVDCEGNVISISWDTVPGAVSYTATLEDFNGKTDCCTSAQNSCDIGNLPCGQMYILLVTAEGRTCNSSESRGMARTAPCVPEKLDYRLNCGNNLASMSWNHSLGGQLYFVTAVSDNNYVDQCYSHENHCELRNLQCGQTYAVNVTAEDMDCSSKPSDNVFIKTDFRM
ncbi:fibronectin type III domain-containing protein 7-like [Periophthalmus magnuspinnatus]|uniref:fibronectin type III domain-containing protein 7-like n=1 Tax=Periophthalmus magnuspinnatus TaxID=409849 RepID=UPI0024367EF0|nr:fibronectin type III domain-containing protein 7-like [Periophthalmus magnuspinnatus]